MVTAKRRHRTASRQIEPEAPVPRPPPEARRWLVFVHQLPSNGSNLRVRTWRRLQQLGAVPVRQAVYVLPDTPAAREDFEWLKTEVRSGGGNATVFAADGVDAWSEDALVGAFRESAQAAYAALAKDVERLLKRIAAPARHRGARAPSSRRLLDGFRERLTAIERIDYFGSVGRDRVLSAVRRLEAQIAGPSVRPSRLPSGHVDAARFRARLWVTRPRPGVDRMASAWLIRTFIDGRARFCFAAALDAVPGDAVPFDMFGVEFSHQRDGCTFETLCEAFGIRDPAVERLAAIVHDLDLKDERFNPPEAATIAAVIEGLQLAHPDDDVLLAHGMVLFDSLYRSFDQPVRGTAPGPPSRESMRTRRPRPGSRGST